MDPPRSSQPPSGQAVSRRTVSRQAWTGLGLLLLGGVGLLGIRAATARSGAGMLDSTDRLLAGGDGAIRLASAAQFGPDPAQRLQMFVPTDRALDPAVTGRLLPIVMFIHGGGWASGDPHDYRFIARMIAPYGHAVVLAGYRLHPDGRYPAMLEDGAAAMGWIADNATAQGGDCARVVLMGHSAGAYNAVMLALDPRWHAASGLPPCALRGIVGLAGPYDFLPLDDHTTISTFGHLEDLDETQPITHVRGDAPPLLLIHGTDDTRVRPRHSIALARAFASCGARSETHLIEGVGHEGLIMRFARPFSRDKRPLAHVLAFLARVTAHDTAASASAPVQAVGA